MSNTAQPERGSCAPKIPPVTGNNDHISDAEKMALWLANRSAKQHFIDLARVGL